MSLLALTEVEKTYPGPAPVLALREVNLTINEGEFVAVVGPSGSGKSTLLNILALLDQPTGGEYAIDGEVVGDRSDVQRARLRSRWFAFIFQAFHLLESRTVLANVEMGLMYRRVSLEERRAQAEEAIRFVGLADKAASRVNTLSGGQRQRVAIARAIAAGAPILVADEPTGSLDSVTSKMVMDVLEKLQSRGTTVVLVTHDPNVAARAQRRIQVFDGRVSEIGGGDQGGTGFVALGPDTPGGAESHQYLPDTVLLPDQILQDGDPGDPFVAYAEGRMVGDDPADQANLADQADLATPDGLPEGEDGDTTLVLTLDGVHANAADGFNEDVALDDEPLDHDSAAMDDPADDHDPAPGRIGSDAAVYAKDIIQDAWASLTDYPRRMIGMMVAVGLGVAMSLATLGIGQSASSQVSDTFDAERNTLVKAYSPYDLEGAEDIKTITSPATLERLATLAGVESVTALIHYPNVKALAHGSEKTIDLSLFGSPDIKAITKSYPIEWASTHQVLEEHDALIGKKAAEELNLGPLALSPSVIIGGRAFRVVGLVEATGFNFEIANGAFIRPEMADHLGKPEHVSYDIRTMPGAAQQVSEQVPIALWPRDPDAVSVEAPPDPKTMRDEIESNIATMLYTLTGVSIVAAIVALTNAMTTAVGRRTGEFGLRRAMGARRIHIALLVALESGILGFLGGALGTILALLAIMIVTIVQRWVPVFDLKLIPLGLAGGMIVGIFSSLMAMYRAAAIEPADALRR